MALINIVGSFTHAFQHVYCIKAQMKPEMKQRAQKETYLFNLPLMFYFDLSFTEVSRNHFTAWEMLCICGSSFKVHMEIWRKRKLSSV